MTESNETTRPSRATVGQWLTHPVQLPLWFYGVMFTLTGLTIIRILRLDSMVEMALRVAGLILFALILAALAQLGRRVHPKAARLEDKEANAATSDGGSLWTNFPRLLRVMRWPRFMAGILALMSATGVIDLVIRLTA